MRAYKTEKEKAWALINDPEYFAANCLKVPSWNIKGQRGLVDFRYTYLQRRIMNEIDWQIQNRNNEIDLIVVKPRKMRCTSVLNAWEFQRCQFEEALTVLNIAHAAPVAEEIFDRHIKTFQRYMPEWLQKKTKSDNKRELAYEDNLCKFIVAIAGSNTTRGPAASILHLTESGWYDAKQKNDIQMAVLPSVERGPGTAIIDESTSGGNDTWQHRRALAAKNGESDTRLLFVSCYEVPEYRKAPPKDWEPSPEELALMQEYKLDMQQIYWRHHKLYHEFDGQEMLFNMEYPATFDLAFQVSGDRFINPVKLLMAKISEVQPGKFEPAVMGIDSARTGDRTVFVIRKGRAIPYYEVHRNVDHNDVVGIAKRLKARFNTKNEFIDMGYGHGAYDIARRIGMYSMIGIYPGGNADRKDIYANKRTETAFRLKEWIEEGDGGLVSIPKVDEFYNDLAAIPGEKVQKGTGKLIIPAKDDIKKENGGKSTDIFDGASYTFAYEVKGDSESWNHDIRQQVAKQGSMFDTENSFRRFDRSAGIFDNDSIIEDSRLGITINWRGNE